MACLPSWGTGFSSSLGSQLLAKILRYQFLFVLAIVDELGKIKGFFFFFFFVGSRAWKRAILKVFCYPWGRRKRP